jgi:hypothetical protein
VRSKGYLLAFRASDIGAALDGRFGEPEKVLDPDKPTIYYAKPVNIYAGVVVPEFGGAVIGFKVGDNKDGDTRPIKIPNLLPNFRHPEPRLKLAG